jgi:hypothetical protein
MEKHKYDIIMQVLSDLREETKELRNAVAARNAQDINNRLVLRLWVQKIANIKANNNFAFNQLSELVYEARAFVENNRV